MTSITIRAVQGIGDLIWCLQKLTPRYDKINFEILCTEESVVQTRSKKFMQMFPCVGDVSYVKVPSMYYNEVASRKYLVPTEDGPYAVNRWLEEGTRLEAIDGDVDWNLKPTLPPMPVNPPSSVLYVSGSKGHLPSWSVGQWVHFVCQMYSTGRITTPLVLLGAEYDIEPLTLIKQELENRGIQCESAIAMTPRETVSLIANCENFIGYQSGLNVIADLYDRKQVMLYFTKLKPMLNTWCKPEHLKNGLFNAFTFDQTPSQVLQQLKDF